MGSDTQGAGSPGVKSITGLIAGALLVMAALVGASIILCGGSLVYSLDDAYIHLSISEQIARGGYGINPGEMSAPSSSVVWDFLLAPFAGTPFHTGIPLLLNLAALLWAVLLVHDIMSMLLPSTGGPVRIILSIWLALSANLFGLVMTGMEHSLQVALSLAVLKGVMQVASGCAVGRGMRFSMILGPMVRYEMLAVTFGAAAILMLARRRKEAVLLAAAAVLPLLVFSGFLVSRGLPPLPGSVLAKLAEGGLNGGVAESVANRLALFTTDIDAFRFLVLLALLPAAWVLVRDRSSRLVTAFASMVGAAHMLVGRFGWFGRYHVYSLLIILISIAWASRNGLSRLFSGGRGLGRACVVLLPLTVFLLPELVTTLKTPFASRVIFLQQGVMHRIAVAYGDRIAVNDIGWVSYGNPNHVLDLWGLANEESRRHHLERGTGWVEAMVDDDGAGLVMLYGSVFEGEVPVSWNRVALLRMTGPVVVGFPDVDIFVTPSGDSTRVLGLLERISEGLPPGASITLVE